MVCSSRRVWNYCNKTPSWKERLEMLQRKKEKKDTSINKAKAYEQQGEGEVSSFLSWWFAYLCVMWIFFLFNDYFDLS